MKILTALFLAMLPAAAEMLPIPLAGEWRFALDAPDSGLAAGPDGWKFPDKIQLPGMLTAQGFGEIPSFETKWTGDGWRYPKMFKEWQAADNFKFPFFLQPPRHYVGPAWYQRDVEIPADWKGRALRVHLERVHWQSRLWIDGVEAGSRDSLGTPHDYDFAPLAPGKHTLTLRIDNRLAPVNVGPLSHSVTDHTQGNWNGVVGDMTLNALPANRIDRVDIYPANDGHVRLVVTGNAKGSLEIQATCDGPVASTTIHAEGKFTATLEGKVGLTPELWSEFSPKLYDLNVSIGDDSRTSRFGFREIENQGGKLVLNGRQAFLRGTLECAIFPLTGHPPTDVDSWKRIVKICKDHGLNHIRFHSWCPPEAAFVAADELGFYYEVEASTWANQGAEIGSGMPLDAWVDAETARMFAAYGNHPSFLMMAYGNEPSGKNHAKWLAGWVARQQKADPRRLYTTASGWPIRPGSDYFSSPDPRVQRWGEGLKSMINAKAPTTDFDWSDFVKQHPQAPVVSHEIGQWCVYPDFSEIAKYTGYTKAKNFEIFQETAKRNGILDQARNFLMASGKWQAACYKHDIEAALRTPGFGGFQLLDLHDFPGQGTALVGVLNAFWEEKGYISAAEFKRFSGPIVPLARMEKLVFTEGDSLEADLELAHFGPKDFPQAKPAWKLASGDEIIAQGSLPPRDLAAGALHDLGKIRVPMTGFAMPAKLTLTVGLAGMSETNSWDLFVYPKELPAAPAADFTTTGTIEETVAALAAGKKVLWLAPPITIADDPDRPLQIGFSPVFWNTAWTEWQPPHTLGLLIDAKHPALADFPTDTFTNWQWWEIVSRSRPFLLTRHHDLKPIVQPIDDWFTNRKLGLVFEANVGPGKLLACSADLENDLDSRPAARQLRHSLETYLAKPDFHPAAILVPADLAKLVRELTAMEKLGASVRADSEQGIFEAARAIDGDPATFWHSSYSRSKTGPPHEFTLRLAKPAALAAILLTQRQDGQRSGQLGKVEILDGSGRTLATAEVPLNARDFRIDLPQGTRTDQLTLRIPAGRDGPYAAIAEIGLAVAP